MGRKSKIQDAEHHVSFEMDKIWRPVFDKYDTDGDGQICLDEFKLTLAAANTELQDIPREVLAEMVERADYNRDQYLSFDEFLRMVNARDLGVHRPRIQRLIRYASLMVVPKTQRHTVIRKYLEEFNCSPPPFFLILISLVEIIVYVYYLIKVGYTAPFDSVLIYNPFRRYELWRFFTYALIHAGFYHIFFNLIIQLLLGIPLELVHKGWRIGILYSCGLIAGSLGSSISDPNVFLCGASGGVYTLIAAHLANVVINFKEMEYGIYRITGLLAFGASDIFVAIYSRYTSTSTKRISYSAHFMGALTGLLLGVIALRNLHVRKWEIAICWIAGLTWIILMAIVILWNVFYDDYFPAPKYDSISKQ